MITVTPLSRAGVTRTPPDLKWTGTSGDLELADTGQLVANDALATAVSMLLFTDARAPVEALRFEHGGDRRGYPGDALPLRNVTGGMGSRLWLLRRSVLNEKVAFAAAVEAERALQPLVRQGVAASINVTARHDNAIGTLFLSIEILGRDGRRLYAETYDLVWRNPK